MIKLINQIKVLEQVIKKITQLKNKKIFLINILIIKIILNIL